ncbi:MAG: PorT family protein [Bacteroidaceae bacterium]|nr:PorT family protein [Bacteroidaceae bacterium]
MKRIYSIIVALVAITVTANAQLKFGAEAGLNINKLSLDKDIVSASNRAGFFLGPKVRFTVPIIGVGADAAILYSNRSASLEDANGDMQHKAMHYIELPVNLRYQLEFTSLIGIYVTAGPQWSWNLSDKEWNLGSVTDAVTGSVTNLSSTFEKSSMSINVGAGVLLFSHLQIGASYNIPVGNDGVLSTIVSNATAAASTAVTGGESTKLKNNTWQIRATYWF